MGLYYFSSEYLSVSTCRDCFPPSLATRSDCQGRTRSGQKRQRLLRSSENYLYVECQRTHLNDSLLRLCSGLFLFFSVLKIYFRINVTEDKTRALFLMSIVDDVLKQSRETFG